MAGAWLLFSFFGEAFFRCGGLFSCGRVRAHAPAACLLAGSQPLAVAGACARAGAGDDVCCQCWPWLPWSAMRRGLLSQKAVCRPGPWTHQAAAALRLWVSGWIGPISSDTRKTFFLGCLWYKLMFCAPAVPAPAPTGGASGAAAPPVADSAGVHGGGPGGRWCGGVGGGGADGKFWSSGSGYDTALHCAVAGGAACRSCFLLL